MTTLTRAEIAALTGLPRSTLARQLTRFSHLRAERGRYRADDPEFAAWLQLHQLRAADSEPPEPRAQRPRQRRLDPFAFLPSGIATSWELWDRLRGPDETDAIQAFEQLAAIWHLRPHPAVPDLLPFEPMTLPSGLVVNQHQWRILRGRSDARAECALDVLIRCQPDPRP